MTEPTDEAMLKRDKAEAYSRDLDDSGLSGDDVNRRLRERRLGWADPSADWEANKGKVVRCIFAGQTITRRPSSNDVFYHGPGSWTDERGPYTCTCDNWGPRFIEDSLNGCCPGCWKWALDHHQEMQVNGVIPFDREAIKRNTWGIYVANLDKLNNN